MGQPQHLDSLTTLTALVGALGQRLETLETEMKHLRERLDKASQWAVEVERERRKKRRRTAPEKVIKATDVERCYQILRKATGKNWQSDSEVADKCRDLMRKYGVDKVCQVVAYACRRNNERGAQEWSQPSTLFRPSNFKRHLDQMVASHG